MMGRVCDDCNRTYANDETFQRHLSEHNCPRGYNRKMNKVRNEERRIHKRKMNEVLTEERRVNKKMLIEKEKDMKIAELERQVKDLKEEKDKMLSMLVSSSPSITYNNTFNIMSIPDTINKVLPYIWKELNSKPLTEFGNVDKNEFHTMIENGVAKAISENEGLNKILGHSNPEATRALQNGIQKEIIESTRRDNPECKDILDKLSSYLA